MINEYSLRWPGLGAVFEQKQDLNDSWSAKSVQADRSLNEVSFNKEDLDREGGDLLIGERAADRGSAGVNVDPAYQKTKEKKQRVGTHIMGPDHLLKCASHRHVDPDRDIKVVADRPAEDVNERVQPVQTGNQGELR